MYDGGETATAVHDDPLEEAGGEGRGQVQTDGHSSCTLAVQCNEVWVSAELDDVCLDPDEGLPLVPKALVSLNSTSGKMPRFVDVKLNETFSLAPFPHPASLRPSVTPTKEQC